MAKAKETKEILEETETKETVKDMETADTAKKGDGRVCYTLPPYVITHGEDQVAEVCVNGKIYQVEAGKEVCIPETVKEALENAVEQQKKVNAMIKKRTAGSVEIAGV